MAEITAALDRLSERLNKLTQEFPDKRRMLHEELSETLLETVQMRTPISVSGHKIKGGYHVRGTLRSWQEKTVGSGGGYAAVRAASEPSGTNGPGAITNYVENGHAIRRPSGIDRNYRRRARVVAVAGRHFYAAAKEDAPQLLQKAADTFVEELAKELNKPL